MPVMKMELPEIGFGFRWEPESRRLFVIHQNGASHEQIAADIHTPEAAQALVAMWGRGYRSRMREITRAPGAPHRHMFAESGKIGVKPLEF